MSVTTGQILLKIAEKLRPVYYGTSTSAGTTTTLTDTTRGESDGYFNGGTIFFLSGNVSGLSRHISNYSSSTGVFTFSALSVAPENATEYAVIDKKYPRGALVAALNSALSEIGPFVQIDESLTTVCDQEIYTLPSGVYNVLRVVMAECSDQPYMWDEPYRWWTEQGGYLYFDDDHLPGEAGLPIRLFYGAAHVRVTADSDTITNDAHPDLVAVLAAFNAARNKAGISRSSDPEPGTVMQLLAPQIVQLRAQHPPRRMMKDARYPVIPNIAFLDSTINIVSSAASSGSASSSAEEDVAALGAYVFDTTGQTIYNQAYTALSFDTALVNTDTNWSSSAPTKLYARTAGYYMAGGAWSFYDTSLGAANYRMKVSVVKNHATDDLWLGSQDGLTVCDNLSVHTVSVATGMFYMAAGDYIEIYAYQDQGADKSDYAANSHNMDFKYAYLTRVGS